MKKYNTVLVKKGVISGADLYAALTLSAAKLDKSLVFDFCSQLDGRRISPLRKSQHGA